MTLVEQGVSLRCGVHGNGVCRSPLSQRPRHRDREARGHCARSRASERKSRWARGPHGRRAASICWPPMLCNSNARKRASFRSRVLARNRQVVSTSLAASTGWRSIAAHAGKGNSAGCGCPGAVHFAKPGNAASMLNLPQVALDRRVAGPLNPERRAAGVPRSIDSGEPLRSAAQRMRFTRSPIGPPRARSSPYDPIGQSGTEAKARRHLDRSSTWLRR